MLVLANDLLPASVIAYASCFALTMFFLGKKTRLFDRILLSSATTFSGIWLYEIAYHYSWGLGGLPRDLATPSVAIGGDVPFPIYFALFLAAVPLLARRQMTFNRAFLFVAIISLILFAVWNGVGFPQFWCVCSYEPVWGVWLPRDTVEPLGYVMNSLTKLLAVVPAFLFFPDPKHTGVCADS
jgi:hypothetical protein